MSGGSFGYLTGGKGIGGEGGVANGHLVGRNRGYCKKRPPVHRIAPPTELSSPKCHGYYPISLIKETDAEIFSN